MDSEPHVAAAADDDNDNDDQLGQPGGEAVRARRPAGPLRALRLHLLRGGLDASLEEKNTSDDMRDRRQCCSLVAEQGGGGPHVASSSWIRSRSAINSRAAPAPPHLARASSPQGLRSSLAAFAYSLCRRCSCQTLRYNAPTSFSVRTLLRRCTSNPTHHVMYRHSPGVATCACLPPLSSVPVDL